MKFFGCFKRQKTKEPPDTEYMRERKNRDDRMMKKRKKDTDLYIRDKEEQTMKKYREEPRINKRYHDFEYKCQGYFAKVYKAKDINNREVAIKRINIQKSKRFYDTAKQECYLLNAIDSPHIIKIIDAFKQDGYLYIILPLYKMDLFEYIPNLIGKPNKIFKILLGISKGLKDLHDINLMHGDVKPENVMLSDTLEPIIIDLGLARSYNIITINRDSNLSGTLTYLPPEVIEHRIYTEKMDIWALGVMMYMIMFNEEPFLMRDNNKTELFHNIRYKEQFYPLKWKIGSEVIYREIDIYTKMVELNKWMLRKKYNDRPSIDQVLTSFKNIITDMDKSRTQMHLKISHDLMIDHLHTFKTM